MEAKKGSRLSWVFSIFLEGDNEGVLRERYPKNGPGEGKGDEQEEVGLQLVNVQGRFLRRCGIATENNTSAAKAE